MTFARIRLAVAAVAFVGWLSWLAVAVWQKDVADKVSRAQLTAAAAVVVAEVTVGEDGLPLPKAKVTRRVGGTGPAVGDEITVTNLPSAVVPGKGFPGAGQYLLPLAGGDLGVFRVAGLPRSPGYEETTPKLPSIYPWTADVQAQLTSLNYEW
jgi:hypothetical protein